MMCSCSSGEWQTTCPPFALRLLLHPHVLGEIIIGGMVAFVDLHAACAVVAWVEHALEKRELQRPSGFRLRTAIARRINSMVSTGGACGSNTGPKSPAPDSRNANGPARVVSPRRAVSGRAHKRAPRSTSRPEGDLFCRSNGHQNRSVKQALAVQSSSA